MKLKEEIEKYVPYDEQEERDKEQMLNFINSFDDVLTRNNIFGHFSASAFVVNKEKTKMIVAVKNDMVLNINSYNIRNFKQKFRRFNVFIRRN